MTYFHSKKSYFEISDVGRLLIPRFFRTLFDDSVSEVYFLFKQPKEIFHHPIISIDCEQGSLITCFGKPSFIKVNHQKEISNKEMLFRFSGLYGCTF